MAKPKKSASAKAAAKSAAKPAAKKTDNPARINWPRPGGVRATLYLGDYNSFTSIWVSLMPGVSIEESRDMNVRADSAASGYLDINNFETVFERLDPPARYVTATFSNKSPTAKTFELAFIFSAVPGTSQAFKYTVDSDDDLTVRIPVVLT